MKKILVLDDEWSVLELLRVKLSKQGYEVLTARNAEEFRLRAFRELPDLVILDIWLGNQGGGTQVYEDVIHAGFDPSIPVIFISALIEEGTPPRHAPEGGKFAMYGKPFDFDELLQEIRSLLNAREKTGVNPALLKQRQLGAMPEKKENLNKKLGK